MEEIAVNIAEFFGSIRALLGPFVDDTAKQVCEVVDGYGYDCRWRASRAVLICAVAVLVTILLSLIGMRVRLVRRALDGLYTLGGMLAALFMLAMLIVIVMQMWSRWTGQTFPGSTAIAGYCMAASSFLALAYALNSSSHIRVSLLLGALGRFRRIGEIWCFGVAALLATYFARYAVKHNISSEKINDISQDLDKTPLWIPQIAMSIGVVLLAIALWDNLTRMVVQGRTNLVSEGLRDDDSPPLEA